MEHFPGPVTAQKELAMSRDIETHKIHRISPRRERNFGISPYDGMDGSGDGYAMFTSMIYDVNGQSLHMAPAAPKHPPNKHTSRLEKPDMMDDGQVSLTDRLGRQLRDYYSIADYSISTHDGSGDGKVADGQISDPFAALVQKLAEKLGER
ncbi:hypothetical protein [Beijerinckia mobilis]|uniref:hypothetical protein n=1 Tax=Beijerinckia mobilis TaxID=231434 RepID=UPI0005588F02|nr:hypothetical protein [Beijerinckia mobilis]